MVRKKYVGKEKNNIKRRYGDIAGGNINNIKI